MKPWTISNPRTSIPKLCRIARKIHDIRAAANDRTPHAYSPKAHKILFGHGPASIVQIDHSITRWLNKIDRGMMPEVAAYVYVGSSSQGSPGIDSSVLPPEAAVVLQLYIRLQSLREDPPSTLRSAWMYP
jgi:hypothetical protein